MTDKLNSIILFLFFLSFGSVYLFLFGGEFLLLGLLGISLMSFCYQSVYSLKLLRDFCLSTGVMLLILLLNWVATGFSMSIIEYPKFMFRVVVVNFAMVALYNHKTITYKNFEWLFLLVVVHSTLNFIFGFIFRPYLVTVSSSEAFGYQASSLYYLFFYIANVNIAGVDVFRNQSFFWEPGILGFVLNLYLIILLLVKPVEKRNIKLILVVCVLIITTFSTTALGLMCLQFCIYFFRNKISFKKILLLIIGCLILVPIFISNLKEKTSGPAEGSFIMRHYDSLIAIDIIKVHPIFGLGLSSEKYLAEQKKYPRFFDVDLEEGKANSNSILGAFVSFGIPLTLLVLFALYRQKLLPDHRGLIFFFFLIFLASEPLLLSLFFLMLMSSAFYRTEYIAGKTSSQPLYGTSP